MSELRLILIFLFLASQINAYEIVSTLQNSNSKNIKWSILICTLENRKSTFEKIYNKLKEQIRDTDLSSEIEIVYFKDDRQFTVGYKRNILLQKAKGEYVCFVDDDDDVHDKYIQMIYEKIQNKPDVISLKGIINFINEGKKKLFIHSIKYKTWFSQDDIDYRCPNHLNVIKRTIAARFIFPAINNGEDADWSFKIARSGALKYEEEINEPYYFYQYDNKKKKDRK